MKEKCVFWQLVRPAGQHSLMYYTTIWMDKDGCWLHLSGEKYPDGTLLIYILPQTPVLGRPVIINFKRADVQYSLVIIYTTFTSNDMLEFWIWRIQANNYNGIMFPSSNPQMQHLKIWILHSTFTVINVYNYLRFYLLNNISITQYAASNNEIKEKINEAHITLNYCTAGIFFN